jgi:hypothetical protein
LTVIIAAKIAVAVGITKRLVAMARHDDARESRAKRDVTAPVSGATTGVGPDPGVGVGVGSGVGPVGSGLVVVGPLRTITAPDETPI